MKKSLVKLCKEEHLYKAQFKALIDAYIYSGREPIKNEVFQCIDNPDSADLQSVPKVTWRHSANSCKFQSKLTTSISN